jgi:hypothetical protein
VPFLANLYISVVQSFLIGSSLSSIIKKSTNLRLGASIASTR